MKRGAYPIPELPIADTVCIRVEVPAHSLSIGTFWETLSFLGKWVAYEPDSGQSAKEYAALWKVLINAAREQYERSLGDCGIMDVRQNTGAPCILEKSDDGLAWEQFADLSLCHRGVDFEGNPPREGSKGLPHDDEADDWFWFWFTIIIYIDTERNRGTPEADIRDYVCARVLLRTGVYACQASDKLITAIHSHTTGQLLTLTDAMFFDGGNVRDAYLCSEDHTYDKFLNDHNTLLEEMGEFYIDWLTDASNWLADAIIELMQEITELVNPDVAWGRVARAERGNGAGFGYSHVCDEDFVSEVLIVPLDAPAGDITDQALLAGCEYMVAVYGTGKYGVAAWANADPLYIQYEDMTWHANPPKINGVPLVLDPYPPHSGGANYQFRVSGDPGGYLIYAFGDAEYTDNSGTFTVYIAATDCT